MLHQNRFIHNFQYNNASDQFLSYLSPIPYSITLGFISYLFYNCYLMSNLNNPQYKHFPLIILIGRPASGKSEIIDYLQHTESAERINRFHIAELDILDDFPMLYTWFEEDQILEDEFVKPRLHTEPDEYFKYDYLWDLLIKRLELEYQKRVRDIPAYHEHTTTIIEFSRGAAHGGYTQAFQQFSPELLQSASVLYVDVPYAESLRKNRLRFNPDRPDSILEHGLPDEKVERLYRHNDWEVFSGADKDNLQIDSIQVPYAVFVNEDDVTSGTSGSLGDRLEFTLKALWDIFRSN